MKTQHLSLDDGIIEIQEDMDSITDNVIQTPKVKSYLLSVVFHSS